MLTMRVLLAAALALASADAATRVAVIELGKSGVVRRTTARDAETSAEGVASFWSALHGYGRKLQHAGMTVVPDLFSRPESGVIVSLNNVDLDSMPNLNNLMTHEENGVVGHMEVPGHQSSSMLMNLNIEDIDASAMSDSVEKHSAQSGLSGMKMDVTNENAEDIDAKIAAIVNGASASDKTVVLHLVVDEDDGAARRRRLARRLSGDDDNRDNENEEGDNEDADADGNAQQYNGYYGYGYYNAYGEWVTPYKTMFQIQYFNIVLWTAVGLFGILFFSVYLFMGMPMMADTLLFGESARMAMDD